MYCFEIIMPIFYQCNARRLGLVDIVTVENIVSIPFIFIHSYSEQCESDVQYA